MAPAPEERSAGPLGPVEFVVNVLSAMTLLLLVAVGLTGAFGSGDGFLGGEDVCVSSDPLMDQRNDTFSQGQLSGGEDTGWFTETVQACAESPDAAQRLLYAVVAWVPVAFWAGLLILLRTLVRRGRRNGMFTEAFARGVTRVGAYLLVGSILVAVVHGIAGGMFLATLIADAGSFYQPVWGALPLSALVAGFGLLTIGRVLHLAVAMRADLEATI